MISRDQILECHWRSEKIRQLMLFSRRQIYEIFSLLTVCVQYVNVCV